jgi:putative membrane protein
LYSSFLPTLSEEIGYKAIPISAVLGLLLYLIVSIGQVMLVPFEATLHDTPMSSIVRTIEINLLELLSDDNIPSCSP